MVAVLAAVALSLGAAPAVASPGQESSFQDNTLLLADLPHLQQTLQTLKLLGVEPLRITVEWSAIAPDTPTKPAGFAGADPASYAAANWAPYDAIATEAPRFGMGVNFDLTGGAPRWAVGRAPAASMASVWYPSAAEFGAFVKAVATRYSGSYTPQGAPLPLPRVSYWSIWNEPNVGSSSLSPQVVHGVEVAPRLYRGLVDAAYRSLQQAGHGRDTILVGELASTGHIDPGLELGMQPLRFLRALFCVDANYRPLRGSAAAARGCPSDATGSRRFAAQHPALFNATGWSHHPYHLTMAPDAASPPEDPDWVTFADLPKLEHALDRVQRVYGSHRRYSIYLTEYGFETDPPKPDFATVTPAQQARYLNQAEYMAWRDPRVAVLSQYLLRDAPPGGGSPVSSFASGLEFLDGAQKASFAAYRLPIWLPQAHGSPGQSLEVWGSARAARLYPSAAARRVAIQLNGHTVRSVTVTNPRGYFDVHVKFPRSGNVRLAWTDPHGSTVYSRSVALVESPAGLSVFALVAAGCGVILILGSSLWLRRRRGGRRQLTRR